MRFENSFTVPLDADATFSTLLDVERVAPCLPGVALTGRDGDIYEGALKLKLGPVLAHYQGKAEIRDVDRAARSALLVANGSEVGASGAAEAQVELTVRDAGGGSEVVIVTDLNIRGRAAQFGRGVMADVAQRMTDQFAENVKTIMVAGETAPAGQAAGGTSAAAAPAAEPLDVLGMGLEPLLRRFAPYLGALVAGFLLGRLLSGRRRDAGPGAAFGGQPPYPPYWWTPPPGAQPPRDGA